LSALGLNMGPGGPPGAGPGGPPPGAAPSIQIGGPQGDAGDTGQSDGDAEQDLHDALDALHAFLQDDADHVDKAQVAKCVAIVQGLLATRQKGQESLLGISPMHKAMSRGIQ